ncbi:MAG: hypothetical protein P8Z80_20050, partial [Pseudolabrys sp.]
MGICLSARIISRHSLEHKSLAEKSVYCRKTGGKIDRKKIARARKNRPKSESFSESQQYKQVDIDLLHLFDFTINEATIERLNELIGKAPIDVIENHSEPN